MLGDLSDISEEIPEVGWFDAHVDVHLLVSNALCWNLCNIEQSI